jgi:hypothetical protein
MASVAILLAGTVPSMARDYPWCEREPGTGGALQCRYQTIEQCQASASGQGGGCTQNPAMTVSPGLQSNNFQSSQDDRPLRVTPHRRPSRVKHQPGKHGWYYE